MGGYSARDIHRNEPDAPRTLNEVHEKRANGKATNTRPTPESLTLSQLAEFTGGEISHHGRGDWVNVRDPSMGSNYYYGLRPNAKEPHGFYVYASFADDNLFDIRRRWPARYACFMEEVLPLRASSLILVSHWTLRGPSFWTRLRLA